MDFIALEASFFFKLGSSPQLKLCYNYKMKTLSETNPYLKNKETAKMLNVRSTRTSCGVEGIIAKPPSKNSIQIDTSRSKAVFLRIKSQLNQD